MFARRSVCDSVSSRAHTEQEARLCDACVRALTIDPIGFVHIAQLFDYA